MQRGERRAGRKRVKKPPREDNSNQPPSDKEWDKERRYGSKRGDILAEEEGKGKGS